MTPSDTRLPAHAEHDVVAYDVDRTWTAGQLAADVARVARHVPAGGRCAVVAQDRYLFAVGLLACWEVGGVALLPQSLAEGALEALAADADVVLGDGPGHGVDVRGVIGASAAVEPARLAKPADATVLVRLTTSGSTGAARPVDKTAAQLLREADALGARFEVQPGDRWLATIPPHHIYGLLFSVLVPLRHGGAFDVEAPFFAESIAHRLDVTGARTLVTVPAHLRILSLSEAPVFAELRRVFSSGAPLPERTAAQLADRFDLHVTEVFGSTETGGIAWRERRRDPVWTALPGVSVDEGEGGRLLLDSPWLPPDAPRPWPGDDRVELVEPGRFRHHGRLDDVVKIASKRVSLGQVERALLGVDGVRDAAVACVEQRGRKLLKALVAADVPMVDVRRALARQLDGVAIPRLLAVDTLPRSATGKLPRAALLAALHAVERSEDDTPGPHLRVHRASTDGHHHTRDVEAPPGCRWFEGHFPGQPVLPGVVQLLELVAKPSQQAWPELGAVSGAPRVRFHTPVGPGQTVQVALERHAEAPEVAFAIRHDGTPVATGTLRFRPREDA